MLTPDRNSGSPRAFDAAKVVEILAELEPICGEQGLDAEHLELLKVILGNSPYLASLIRRYPEETVGFMQNTASNSFDTLVRALSQPRPADESDADFMSFLRHQKNLAALLIAMADCSGTWPLETVTKRLSEFANLCLELAIAKALRIRMKAGDLPWPDGLSPSSPVTVRANESCGYFILGLGKLGAEELNYSSDIDLIALYDPEKANYIGRKSVSDCFIKLTQDVVRYIDQRTMHGYVFRVDLRLRPDPGATPVAMSLDAALGYYHSVAANWERSAMIKASFAAGDPERAQAYLEELAAWVWRRNMDFEALKDIAAIKNQINRHYDVEDAEFAGFDVKLGVGGIREIEFYAQVNQLLHGGRNPSLRMHGTLDTLKHLHALELAPQQVCNDLIAAYKYLRTVEHRIQMIHDEQTHSIPMAANDIERLACFLGYTSPEDFRLVLDNHTKLVSQHYDELLPDSGEKTAVLTEKQLRKLLVQSTFQNVDSAYELIAAWQYGRYRSLKTNRARALLAQCLPELMSGFSQSSSPDAALIRFDAFLSQLPAGVQLFSLLQSNPSLLGLLTRIIGLAPALSSILAKTPGLWDTVLDGQFFAPIEDKTLLGEELRLQLSAARDYQDVLDYVRRFAAEKKFRSGVHMLEGIAGTSEIGAALSDVADVILRELVPAVEADFAAKHGCFEGHQTGIGIIALGKYGGRELTHTSDLDIVFVYPSVSDGSFSNGQKPLSANVYYTRLAQHIITAITALTPEGRLFEVDTRLRPSGNQGPLAASLDSFGEYYMGDAWTWEFLALTRARLIYSQPEMNEPVNTAIRNAFNSLPAHDVLEKDAVEMRRKLADEFATDNIWDVKHIRGGLVDIEFICQFLSLKHYGTSANGITANTPECLNELLSTDVLHEKEFQSLLHGYKLQMTVQSLLRLCLEPIPRSGDDIPIGLQEILLENSYFATMDLLLDGIRNAQRDCYALFKSLVGK